MKLWLSKLTKFKTKSPVSVNLVWLTVMLVVLQDSYFMKKTTPVSLKNGVLFLGKTSFKKILKVLECKMYVFQTQTLSWTPFGGLMKMLDYICLMKMK